MKNSKIIKKRSLKKVFGTLNRPRLSVFRSNKHIYAQIINDEQGETLAFASSLNTSLFSKEQSTSNIDAAFIVGQEIAKKAKGQSIEKVIFDRGNRPYHGRIQNLAEGARKEGLIF